MKLHSPLLFVVDCLNTLLKTNISAHRPDHQAIRIFQLITYLSMAKGADWLVDVGSIFEVERMPFFDFVLIASLMLVTYMIFIFGIVMGMEGVKFSVKRYRRLAAVASFVVLLFYSFFTLQGLSVFASFLMPMLPIFHNIGFISMETNVMPYFSIILTGIIFMIIGLVMYEKRAEI